jgi:hypothetical protein
MSKPLDLSAVEIRGGPLVLASQHEVDELEAALGVRLPDGYREYVTTLGEGSLNVLVRVYPPWRVLSEREEHQALMAGFWGWDSGDIPFGQEEAMESIPVADTLDGDVIAFHPLEPNRLIILPRDDERLYARSQGLLEAINWICSGRVLRSFGPQRYFEPFDSRLVAYGPPDSSEIDAPTTPGPDPTAGLTPREVLLGYFAELLAVEEYAVARLGGPAALAGDDPPGEPDELWDDLIRRSNEAHARYCTPRLAQAFSGSSVTVGWPPEHAPSAIRVIDERETRPGRVAIRTAEGTGVLVRRQEYALERSGDSWRISALKHLGYD